MVQKNIRTSDWRSLQASLDDLKTLAESHSDAAVRKMAEKLRLVIATHGAVLKETDALKERTDRVRIVLSHGLKNFPRLSQGLIKRGVTPKLWKL